LFNPKVENVLHKFLNPFEQELLNQMTNFQFSHFNLELFTLGWSIKEAVYKWYGDGGLDFKEHMHIDNILFTQKAQGVAYCRLLKHADRLLPVQFLFFKNNCVAWVLGSLD
jgi:4'-phosphopantetheinyl transferase